jgi:hypothetical protein
MMSGVPAASFHRQAKTMPVSRLMKNDTRPWFRFKRRRIDRQSHRLPRHHQRSGNPVWDE